MVDFDANPERTALINVDMQNCFVENSPFASPDGRKLLPRINRLIDVCREFGVMVIHVAHVVRPDGTNIGVLGEILPVVRTGIINAGSFTAALHKDLNVKLGDIVIEKPRYGAFHGTDLDLILRSNGIDTVIISGISTNVCCDTTAREANARDFKVFFLTDGTATLAANGVPAEELHRVHCATLGAVFAQLITVEQLISKIRAGATY